MLMHVIGLWWLQNLYYTARQMQGIKVASREGSRVEI